MRAAFALLGVLSLVIPALGGCQGNPRSTITYSLPAGYEAGIEVKDAYAQSAGGRIFLSFNLVNLTGRAAEIDYIWTLNDPKASGPYVTENINTPGGRQYEGGGNLTLMASSTKNVTVKIRETRDYDPSYYVMFIYVYQDGVLTGYYCGQKPASHYDYSVLPPVPRTKT